MDKGQKLSSISWMVTFSDIIMLLLTFFVMLITMSSMDNKLLTELFFYLRGASSILELSGPKGITDLGHFVRTFSETKTSFILDSKHVADYFLPLVQTDEKIPEIAKKVEELIKIVDDERGIVISFQENILFDPGKATIKSKAFRVLDEIAKAICSCPNEILIMGHTDNRPIHSRLYKSNWGLSSYRGLSVLEYFVNEKELSPSRFSVGGYGASRPLYPNDTPRHRALNRRVEIIFKHI